MPLPLRSMIYNHVHEQTYCFILGFLHVIYMKYFLKTTLGDVVKSGAYTGKEENILPKISETLPLCPAYSIMKI